MSLLVNDSEKKGLVAFIMAAIWIICVIGGGIAAFTMAGVPFGILVLVLAGYGLPTVLSFFKKADKAK